MNILISSHLDYYTKTLPPLLTSLSANGVPAENIIVVIGGVTGSIATASYAAQIHTVPYNAMDFTAPLWLSQSPSKFTGSVCLLPDTCMVTGSFWNQIQSITDLTRLTYTNASNIGVYPVKILQSYARWFQQIRQANQPIKKQLCIIYMDYIFDQKFCRSILNESPPINQGIADIYGTGVLREKIFYSEIGLVKYKANYATVLTPVIKP